MLPMVDWQSSTRGRAKFVLMTSRNILSKYRDFRGVFSSKYGNFGTFFPKKILCAVSSGFYLWVQKNNTGAGSVALTGKLKIFLHISKFTRL
jgi:hypothetical protein